MILGTTHCKNPTEITLQVLTDVPFASERSVVISAGPHPDSAEPIAATDAPWGADGNIGTLVLTPKGDKSANVRVLVVLGVAQSALKCSIDAPQGCIVARRQLAFIEHSSLQLPIGMHALCEGVKCDEDRTCNALGDCVSADLDPNRCNQPGGCIVPNDRLPAGIPSGLDAAAPDASRGVEDGAATDTSVDAADASPIDASEDGTADAGQDGPCPSTGNSVMRKMPQNYCIDSTEVTASQYAAWMAANPAVAAQDSLCQWNTDYTPSCSWPSTDGALPVVCVDWCDAHAYCKAMGKRLCGKIGGGASDYVSGWDDASQDQWHNACTSGGMHVYPYGDTYDARTCHVAKGGTVAVGSKTKCQSSESGYGGVYDLSGNVMEWVDSCNGTTGSSDVCRVRGGGYGESQSSFGCSAAAGNSRGGKNFSTGFRCCVR